MNATECGGVTGSRPCQKDRNCFWHCSITCGMNSLLLMGRLFPHLCCWVDKTVVEASKVYLACLSSKSQWCLHACHGHKLLGIVDPNQTLRVKAANHLSLIPPSQPLSHISSLPWCIFQLEEVIKGNLSNSKYLQERDWTTYTSFSGVHDHIDIELWILVTTP